MQQDVLSTVSVIIASVSVTLGVVYYLLNSRRARKREKIDIVMRFYASFNTKEFHDADSLVLEAEFTDFADFIKQYGPPTGQKPIHLAIRQISSAYELLGFLLHNKFIDLSMVWPIFEVERHWETIQPIAYAARKAYNDPNYLHYFEYLYNQWQTAKKPQ
ncbi:MAG: hypothetical protein ACFFDE_07480 [Promethearchaeota archaeon]